MEATTDLKSTPSRHYFYRKASQSENSPYANKSNNSSTTAFEDRIDTFINKRSIRTIYENIHAEATQNLLKRKADRKARKEKEELAARASSSSDNVGSVNSTTNNSIAEEATNEQQERFIRMSTLSTSQQNAWLVNIHDDAMLMNPHQWLKLASLFNVHSKATRIHTFLDLEHADAVLEDRGIKKDDVKPLEGFMELRDIQNRNYARAAVIEGVKLFKQHKIDEALDFYKRALDMDPKYADGWYHVAECLFQQKKLADAEEHLERALKYQPDHEEAKALLANLQRKTKPKKQDEWDLVDDYGESISKKAEDRTETRAKSRDASKIDNNEDTARTREKRRRVSHRSRSRESDRDRRESRRRRRRSRESSPRRKDRSRSRQRDSSKHSRRKREERSESRENRRSDRSRRHRQRDDDDDERTADRRRNRSRSREDGRRSRRRRSPSRSKEDTSRRRRRSRDSEARTDRKRRRSRDTERSPVRRSKISEDDVSSKRHRDNGDHRSTRIDRSKEDTHRSKKREYDN